MNELDDVRRNDESRAELEQLAAGLTDEQLATSVGGGWTVATVFAHLAFWDRTWRRRWTAALAEDDVVARDPLITDDMLNEIVEPLIVAVDGRPAVGIALDAAVALDSLIATLPRSAVEATAAAGNGYLTDRSGHRREHIDQIRRALR